MDHFLTQGDQGPGRMRHGDHYNMVQKESEGDDTNQGSIWPTTGKKHAEKYNLTVSEICSS